MSATATWWMIAGEWRAHPARVATAVIAIAIGVALGFAVHLVNASALDRFAEGLATVNGRADLRVEGAGEAGFDERLYPRLARLTGIAAASPEVLVTGAIDGRPVQLVGLDPFRAAGITPALLPRAAGDALQAVFAPDALFLPPALIGRHPPGTRLPVGGIAFRVAGTAPGAGPGTAILDIAAAQTRFGRLGRIDRVELKLAPGADRDVVNAAIARLLPRDALLGTPADDASRTDALSRAYRVNLDMLALVALLTGAFLVYSAQALAVARRRTQFALLRVLGAPRRQVLGQVLAEGAVLGLLGAAIGVALGLGIAAGVLRLVGGDLGSGAFAGEGTPPLRFAPGGAALFALLGLAAALIGSALPARAAAREAPAVALKDAGDAVDPRRRPAILPALLLGLTGGGCALLPAAAGLPLFGYLAIALLLAAGIAAMPWLARVLLAPLARRRFAWPPAELAVRRLWGAPSQAAVALAGIVASIGLMVAMAVMVTSFRHSVDEWLGQLLTGDVYVSLADAPGAALSPADQARLAAVPGVARILFGRQRPLRLDAARPAVILMARPDPGGSLPRIGASARPAPGTVALWVSEPAARLYRLAPGARLVLPLAGGTPATVAGVFRDYARQQGAIALDTGDYDRLTGDRTRTEAAVTLGPGRDAGAAIAGLRRALPPVLADAAQLVPTAALRARALAIFDRSFAITYGLEAVAVLVGLAGVAATVSAQTIARTREFGMLRHLGVTRRQILAALGLEGALVGAVGAVAGIALGGVVAQVLIHVVNPQSFNWTMATRWPIGLLAGVAAALVAAATGTAVLAGRRAVSQDAVRAVREDW